MQKIWNADSQQYAYAIDEDAMYQRIQRKRRGSRRAVNKMEWGLMGVNILAGSLVLVKNILMDIHNPYVYGMTAILYVASAYIFWRRQQRLAGENQFDRSISGDLDHAIRNAQYRERLSFMAFFYAVPMFTLLFWMAYQDDKSVIFLVGIGVFFVLTIVLSIFEHRYIHMRYRKRLEAMKKMLLNE